jgi:glycosyltransferase involved in cell wall biosynthesis
VAELFNSGRVQSGDVFLVTDAWHPGVHQTRYMSQLLEVPVRIIGLWHAGSYDPNDFLGRIARRQWARSMERALLDAYDLNVFATRYHVELFCDAFDLSPAHPRIAQCGWPMEYLPGVLAPYADLPKENIVLFPHRLAPEKQVDMFRDLAGSFPDWRFIVCQETPLPKEEYHRLLARSRVVFSCSLQETLGIGCYEGVLAGAIPVMPDRLSYQVDLLRKSGELFS